MKTVVLFDHFIAGHHYAFAKLFAKYLLELQFNVILILPNKSDEIRRVLLDEGYGSDRIYSYEAKISPKKIRKLGKFNDPLTTIGFWRKVKLIVRTVETESGWSVNYVFFCWLDTFLSNYLPYQIIDFIFPYKWSGLYFHPWYLYENGLKNKVSISSIDNVLKAKWCISVAVHDEYIIPLLKDRIKKKVIHFPEVADSTTPDQSYFLAREIKKRAAGSVSIGLIGLSKRKGLLKMIEVNKMVDQNQFFFFYAGTLTESDYSKSEIKEIKYFFNNAPENAFYYDSYIEEGAKINAVIDALDILFLVYDEFFKSSSNFITKAAHFKKPVLATNKYWIGANTIRYNLGEVVEENDALGTFSALEKLKERILDKNYLNMQFDEYLQIHDERMLLKAFKGVFEACT